MSSLNDRRLRTLVDATSSVFFTAKPDGRVLEAQPSWERFTGQRWPVYRGLGWLDAVHGRDIDLAAGVAASGRRRTTPMPIAARLWHHDSRSFRHVAGQAVPLHDEQGRLVEWVVSVEDVHEHLMAQRRLEETASRLRAVLRNSPVGLALFDRELRFLLLNDALARAAGLDADGDRGSRLDAAPALAAHLAPRLRQVLQAGEPVSGVELRGVALGGAEGRRDWLVSCYPIPGPIPGPTPGTAPGPTPGTAPGPTPGPGGQGPPAGVGATFVDVTERNALANLVREVSEREAQDRFRSALDAMLDLVSILRAARDERGRIVDFRVEHVNRSRPDAAGRGPNEMVGRTMGELYPAFAGSRLFDRYVAVVETREPVSIDELPYRDLIDGQPVDRVFAMQISPFEDGLITVSRDVTGRRRRRLELERTFEQLTAAQRLAHIGIWEIDLATGRISFSDELARILGLPAAPDGPLEAGGTAGDLTLDEAVHRFVHPDDHAVLLNLVAHTPRTGEPFAMDVRLRRADGQRLVASLFGSVAYDDGGPDEPGRDRSPVPVRLWGTLQDVTRHRAAEEELRAAAVRLERERAVVTHLQDALLPEAPHVPGLDLAVRYLPAGSEATVGGDWYDVIRLDEDRVLLAVGDVAGHGVAAAALMAQLRNALRGAAFAGQPPAAVLGTLNAMLLRTSPDAMATALCGLYDRRAETFGWASAGHPPPVLHLPGRGPARLLDEQAGPPLGLPGAVYPPRRSTLPVGATLVLYTDGLVEERGRSIDEGLDRLIAVVGSLGDRPVIDVCEGVTMALFADRERRDDVCLLIARPAAET
jgi:PAS domain S-box-containing protein